MLNKSVFYCLFYKNRNWWSYAGSADLLRAKQALSQLSYSPIFFPLNQTSVSLVGLGRLELPTSPLSGVRSNQLSYRPDISG